MKKQDTLFVDDDGNKIYDGDEIEWTYIAWGMMVDGKLLECVPNDGSYEERKKRQVMKFEKINDTISGYRLNRPQLGWTATDIKMKKIIKKLKKR